MEYKIKRYRGDNWTEDERRVLADLIAPRIIVVENKKYDSVVLAQKRKVWNEIYREFVAQFGTKRTLPKLKDQWKRIKIDSKRKRLKLKNFGKQTTTIIDSLVNCPRNETPRSEDGESDTIKLVKLEEDPLEAPTIIFNHEREDDSLLQLQKKRIAMIIKQNEEKHQEELYIFKLQQSYWKKKLENLEYGRE